MPAAKDQPASGTHSGTATDAVPDLDGDLGPDGGLGVHGDAEADGDAEAVGGPEPDSDTVAGAVSAPEAEFPDVVELSYEDARDELAVIVSRLEAGQVPLDEAMALWRRGEALAAHCSAWLDGAQRQVDQLTGQRAQI